jgi:hypothetical protein
VNPLASPATLVGGGDVEAFMGGDTKMALDEARAVIVDRIAGHPRSAQTAIGPSELGGPCDHCTTCRLIGWKPRRDPESQWLAVVGTAVHAWLERAFDAHEAERGGPRRYLTEERVLVGQLGSDQREIWGSVDLVDTIAGLVLDWKIVGANALRTALSGPRDVYAAQVHLYALGLNRRGTTIKDVAIAYLPRNSQSLSDAVWWSEPYDEALALRTLAHADQLARNADAVQSLGEPLLRAWIAKLPRDPDCYSCPRYPDPPPLVASGKFKGLLTD